MQKYDYNKLSFYYIFNVFTTRIQLYRDRLCLKNRGIYFHINNQEVTGVVRN